MNAHSSSFKTILAIDTTMNGCDVCVYDAVSSQVMSQRVFDQSYGQAEQLVPLIQETLKGAAFKFSEIDLIAVTHGPGSFTGLRTGLTAAKMLSLALSIPVCGISSLSAMAHNYLKLNKIKPEEEVISCIDTRRGDYYCQNFDYDGISISEPSIQTQEQLLSVAQSNDVIFVGEFHHADVTSVVYERVPSESIAEIALQHLTHEGQICDLNPLYLRDAEIGEAKTPRRSLAT